MDSLLGNLAIGFSAAATVENLLYCFIGVTLGTLIGVLPGIGPLATIAMLLPATYKMTDPTSALIMLAGIYYGAQYGGSTTAILVNLPGESSSVVTTLDGYQMARRGRAGPALAMVVLGLLLGMIGTDVNSGVARFSFDIPELSDGIEFVAVAMGMFGFAEIILNLEQREKREVFTSKVGGLMPSASEFKQSVFPMIRGTALGSFLGILPGGGAVLSSFSAYALEKKLSKTPERFGKGAIEGVAGPEAANNAGAQTSFIPMLTLGIPTTPVMALMVAAMMIHNIQPGPQVMTSNPTLFWGLIASMWVGNLLLVILNLPLIGLWIKLLSVPYRVLFPAILLFCCIGAYSINNNVFDVFMTIPFAILGYLFKKFDCEPAPLLLGFVLGKLMEEYLRRALTISRGDPTVFFTRPLSATLLAIAAVLLVLVFLPAISKKREEAFQED
ncbi:MAG: tripartite tricarboxylate transporter permease [Burkholderiales bacterium]